MYLTLWIAKSFHDIFFPIILICASYFNFSLLYIPNKISHLVFCILLSNNWKSLLVSCLLVSCCFPIRWNCTNLFCNPSHFKMGPSCLAPTLQALFAVRWAACFATIWFSTTSAWSDHDKFDHAPFCKIWIYFRICICMYLFI